MKKIKRFRSLSLIGAVILLPAASIAGVGACGGYAPTFPSNYSQEASQLLQTVRDDAQRVQDDIAGLKALANDRDVNWGVHAITLERIQSRVNDMKDRLCRLKVIQRVVAAGESHAIAVVGPQVAAMATNTNRALDHVKRHEGELWSESYRICTQNLDHEAVAVEGRIDRDEQLSELRTRESEFEMNSGPTGK
jgi:hypothetical protein